MKICDKNNLSHLWEVNKGNNREKKIAVSVMAAILLFFLYTVIFRFSAQDGEQSGSLSRMLSEKCVTLINSLAGEKWTDVFMQNMISYFENPIRKLAHFTEYTCMGTCVYIMLRPWIKKGKSLYLSVIIWVFLSAVVDEIHQLYVPNRHGSFADVCLDTCGGVFAILLCIFVEKLYQKGKTAFKRKKEH